MMKICISIVEKTLEGALAASKRAAEKSPDLIEVRFDHITPLPDDLTGFKDIAVPKIATVRPVSQGGKFAGSDREKSALLRRAIKAGFKVIDLESDSPLLTHSVRDFRGADIVCSHHDLHLTPETARIVEILVSNASRGNVTKAAFKVNSVHDILSIVEAAMVFSSTEENFIILGMGELGEMTRVQARRMKCAFTYASLEPGKEAAPGQIDFDTLRRLGDEPVITGITGYPLDHSLSPQMHNAAFMHLGIPGRYLSLPAKDEELEDLMELATELNLKGFNVTIPHKENIIPLLDELDEVASRTKAVNTVVNRNGEFIGMNTDVFGVTKTFEKAGVQVKGRRVLVIGAGGAARACVSYLSSNGARISLVNRTRLRIDVLASDFPGVQVVDKGEAEKMPFDVIINCTPLGMSGFPDELPISPQVFRAGQFVFDTVYNPSITKFMAEAQSRGAAVQSGMEMLVHQAVKAFEAWIGRAPSYEVMAEAARSAMG
jgi:3-dehydroquinate dehydratase-1/3-dehydroquinate dehydratase/shikimate dehydrogenase